jgi:hypothetical protein
MMSGHGAHRLMSTEENHAADLRLATARIGGTHGAGHTPRSKCEGLRRWWQGIARGGGPAARDDLPGRRGRDGTRPDAAPEQRSGWHVWRLHKSEPEHRTLAIDSHRRLLADRALLSDLRRQCHQRHALVPVRCGHLFRLQRHAQPKTSPPIPPHAEAAMLPKRTPLSPLHLLQTRNWVAGERAA